MSAPTQLTPIRQVTPGEELAILLTGACLCGETDALKRAEGIEMEPYDGAETMAAVVNVCLSLVEAYGYPKEGGATPEAWDFVLEERLGYIPDGLDCADYCRQYYQDWRKAQPA
jgi:hypothetical protein